MENSPALMKEYTDLMVLMDMGISDEEEEIEYE